jgi:hydrogenase-1 operon protein HyaF
VVNLSLLPLTPVDIAYMDHRLGTGRVLILSRGYGNCRITNCCVPNTWRVVYYNSQDTVILNSVEVTDMPEVACAAPEDLSDSVERLSEVLQWVSQA